MYHVIFCHNDRNVNPSLNREIVTVSITNTQEMSVICERLPRRIFPRHFVVLENFPLKISQSFWLKFEVLRLSSSRRAQCGDHGLHLALFGLVSLARIFRCSFFFLSCALKVHTRLDKQASWFRDFYSQLLAYCGENSILPCALKCIMRWCALQLFCIVLCLRKRMTYCN